ncbi:hypothetical protein M569_17747 [Genlisea aurea]|uniref:Uncharacterized protein n=1 Tax=Genlisea aurea TaxID=192259 RepID=S8D348_9LAMI|nr:hypothetical protein M569_17747 [Genlisea aurea]
MQTQSAGNADPQPLGGFLLVPAAVGSFLELVSRTSSLPPECQASDFQLARTLHRVTTIRNI